MISGIEAVFEGVAVARPGPANDLGFTIDD